MCLAIPGKIVEVINADMRLAMVDVGGEQRVVNIAFVVDDEHPVSACLGDWVLVNLGFAMSRIDEREAALTLALLHELGTMQAEREATRASASTFEFNLHEDARAAAEVVIEELMSAAVSAVEDAATLQERARVEGCPLLEQAVSRSIFLRSGFLGRPS